MKMTGEDSSRALAESMLAIDAVTQSTNALLQQLLWLLLAKGFFEKSELVAAIDTCIVASRRASAPGSQAAALHLSHIRATIENGDPSQWAH
jgi:hypothetical protein